MESPKPDSLTDCAISLFDMDDPLSFVNRAPRAVMEALAKTPADHFHLKESELQQRAEADDRDIAVRISVWREYHQSIVEKRLMRMCWICDRVMAEHEFRRKLKSSRRFVAYVCIEPPSIATLNQALTRNAFKRCQEFIANPPKKIVTERKFKDGIVIWEKVTEQALPLIEKLAADLRKEERKPPRDAHSQRAAKKTEPIEDEDEHREVLTAPPLSPEAEMEAIEAQIGE